MDRIKKLNTDELIRNSVIFLTAFTMEPRSLKWKSIYIVRAVFINKGGSR